MIFKDEEISMYIKKIPQSEENDCFQHGLCEYLVNALHEEFNYPTVALVQIINERDDIADDEILNMSYEEYSEFFDMTFDEDDFKEATVELYHAFSYVEKGNKIYYIDSTGITNDIKDILAHFGSKPAEGQSIRDHLNWYNKRLLVFKNPEDMQKYFWSTKYDEDSYLHSERRKNAKAFVKEHKRELDVDLQLRKRRERER